MKNEYYNNEFHKERLKSIINELLSFCNTSNRNYIAICGINDFMWDKLILNDFYSSDFRKIKQSEDKNEVIMNYKGNHILLKKSSKPTVTTKNQYYYNWDVFEKPSLNVTSIYELDEDDSISS